MKVLLAVLSSRLDPWWPLIATSKETWDSVEVPDVETVYYVGEPQAPLHDRIVGFAVPEGYKNLGHRNLAFFEWALQREWDLMVRVNATCYVHKHRLKAWAGTAPRENYFGGGGIVGDSAKTHPWMWGGNQFVLSRDVVAAMLANADKWDHTQMDDVSLSRMATSIGVPFSVHGISGTIDTPPEGWRVVCGGESRIIKDWSDVREVKKAALFRCKVPKGWDTTKWIFRKLHEHYQHGTGQA